MENAFLMPNHSISKNVPNYMPKTIFKNFIIHITTHSNMIFPLFQW